MSARSLKFGPRRPNGEFGTFAYNVRTIEHRWVLELVAMYAVEAGHGPLGGFNTCRAAYWRAVADAQAGRRDSTLFATN